MVGSIGMVGVLSELRWVGVIIIIIIWCMGGDGVWYDEE
jgi:hypothetical protein